MEYRQRAYPQFSACGLNCGLCPRYHTVGTSRCPGCGGENFSEKHPTCGVLSCSQRRDLEHCFQCGEFPCKKYDRADQTDSFITHRKQFSDLHRAKHLGMDTYTKDLDEKISFLETLLADYDDGRRKSFYCTALNLLDLTAIKSAMAQLEAEARPTQPTKARAAIAVRLLQDAADSQCISLKLRKRVNSP